MESDTTDAAPGQANDGNWYPPIEGSQAAAPQPPAKKNPSPVVLELDQQVLEAKDPGWPGCPLPADWHSKRRSFQQWH